MTLAREPRTFDVWHEVPLVQQLTGMSCWAAAAAMVVGWRDCASLDAEDVAAAGHWAAYRDGLEPREVAAFARAWGLVVARPAAISVDALRALLEAHGPLWVGEASPSLHVVVLAGMYGDGTPDGTFVRIADPWPIGRGERYTIPFSEFRTNLLTAAALAGGRPQFLHAAPGFRRARAGNRTAATRRLEKIMNRATDVLVILDPGHGGTQTYGGSSPLGYASTGGLAEKHVNLELAQRVAARLGPIARLTRDGDTNLSLRERAQAAARSGARVLVSLHANAGADGARGSEVWIHERHDRGSGELARDLDASLDRAGPTRGVFSGPLAVLDPSATGGCAACLVEADYLSDPHGRSRLTDARGLDALADAISSGVRTFLGRRAYGISHGLPNLNFGPAGPGGRPLGAVTVGTPVTGTPAQIMWADYNDSDTMAGSYHDTVTITDGNGIEVFRESIRPDGLAAGASAVRSVVWYPRQPGPVTVRVRLNSGEYAIPEDNIDDNLSETTATVGVGSTHAVYQSRRYGNPITARQVSAPGSGMTQRYRGDQNIGYVIFYGNVRARHDYTTSFVWLVWPHRRHETDPPASIDIDLTIAIFEEDPQLNTSAQPIDVQTHRVQLAEDQKFGFEYSRLTPQQDYYVRITYIDYGQAQDAGMMLWTNGYG